MQTQKSDDASAITGTVKYRSDSGGCHKEFWIVETDDMVIGRNPYDEDRIKQQASMNTDGRVAILNNGPKKTTIEDIIVLTKLINYEASPDMDGIWMFGRIDLDEKLCQTYKDLSVLLKRLVPNKFSISDIIVDGHKIGQIQFIVGQV